MARYLEKIQRLELDDFIFVTTKYYNNVGVFFLVFFINFTIISFKKRRGFLPYLYNWNKIPRDSKKEQEIAAPSLLFKKKLSENKSG